MQPLRGGLAPLTLASKAPGNGLLANLVAYWGFDEAGGANNALDKHSNALTLTQVASPGSGAGKVYAGARAINGSTQYFYRNSETLLQAGSGSLSIAGWVYWSGQNNRGWIGKYNTSGSTGEYWAGFYSSVGQPYPFFQIRNAANTAEPIVTATVVVATNTWSFIACWYDHDAGTINIQINNGTIYTNNCGAVGIRNSSDALKLGTYFGATEGINGRIGPICLWKSRALDATARTALYNAGAGLAYSAFS